MAYWEDYGEELQLCFSLSKHPDYEFSMSGETVTMTVPHDVMEEFSSIAQYFTAESALEHMHPRELERLREQMGEEIESVNMGLREEIDNQAEEMKQANKAKWKQFNDIREEHRKETLKNNDKLKSMEALNKEINSTLKNTRQELEDAKKEIAELKSLAGTRLTVAESTAFKKEIGELIVENSGLKYDNELLHIVANELKRQLEEINGKQNEA